MNGIVSHIPLQNELLEFFQVEVSGSDQEVPKGVNFQFEMRALMGIDGGLLGYASGSNSFLGESKIFLLVVPVESMRDVNLNLKSLTL